MPAFTVRTFDGSEVEVVHRHPRQSEVLDVLAADAVLHEEYQGKPALVAWPKFHAAALDALSRLVESIGGRTVTQAEARTWLDDHVPTMIMRDAQGSVYAARFAPADLGNGSASGGDG